jgi:hypothetical protein
VPTPIGTYALPVPVDNDVADVPQHMTDLANQLTIALNGKLTKATADGYYQKKITVLKPTDAMPASPAAGDIVFVVP